MTREQAIAELKAMKTTHKSLDMQGINSDVPMDEDSVKALDMAISALSAIEDIKAEIENRKRDDDNEAFFAFGYNSAILDALAIIDKHISGKENE